MSRIIPTVALLLGSLLCACSDDAQPPPEPCDPATDICTRTHAFGSYDVEASGELDGICMSWTLDNDESLWVNSVSTENDGYIHHSNWFFVPEDEVDVADGHWNCWEHDFDEQSAALKGGVLYAQSTQVADEEQRFLPGVALQVPPHSVIIAYTHVLNPTPKPTTTEIRVALETIPETAVETALAPFRLNYSALQIPPMATSEFSGRCEVRDVYETLLKRPLELKLHWILPHFHSLGSAFRLGQVGGTRDGETIFELNDAYGEPLGHQFMTPFDVAADGGTGVSFTCGYQSNRTDEVGFGIGDQEMCVMLGFAESGFLFDGYVNATDTIDTSGSVTKGSGPCTVLGVPFQHASGP